MTRTALYLPLDASEEECEAIISAMSYLDDASPWWRGDAIAQAEYIHGEKYAQWVDILGTSEGYLRNLVWVCNVFPPEDRHPGLSFRHHQEVAPIKDRERRLELLQMAYENGMSGEELRAYITNERIQGARKNQKTATSDKGDFRIIAEPDWSQLVGVKGEIVEAEDGYYFSFVSGIALITPRDSSDESAVE